MDLNFSPEVLIEIQDLWAEELTPYSIEELRSTWALIKQQSFPPSLSDMLNWLQPKLNYEQLFIEAARGDFYLKAVFEAAQQYGQFDIRRDNYEKAKARWKVILDQCFLNYGKDIYIAPPLLQVKPVERVADDFMDSIKKQIDEILSKKKNNANKDWAYKLLKSFKDGETLCESQIRAVGEALEIEPNMLRYQRKTVKQSENRSQSVSRKDKVIVD
jgi:hypothetical protein